MKMLDNDLQEKLDLQILPFARHLECKFYNDPSLCMLTAKIVCRLLL